MGIPAERVARRVKALHEFNPMLGFRGCRLGIVYPEITEMQARAIFEAAVQREAKKASRSQPEVMIPLVGFLTELQAPGEDRRATRPRRSSRRRASRSSTWSAR